MNPDPPAPSGKAHWRTDALLLAALLLTFGALFTGHHLVETWPEQARKHSEELRAELAASLAGVAGEDLPTVLNRQLGQLILDPFGWPTVAFAYVEGQGGLLLAGRVNLPHYSCPIFDCYGTEKEVLDEVRAGRYRQANQYARSGVITHRLTVDEIEAGAVLVIGQKTVHMNDRLSESLRFGQHLLGLVVVLLLVRIGSRLAARMVGRVATLGRERRLQAVEAAWPDVFAIGLYVYALLPLANNLRGKFPLPQFVLHGLMTWPLFDIAGQLLLALALLPAYRTQPADLSRRGPLTAVLILLVLQGTLTALLLVVSPATLADLFWVLVATLINHIGIIYTSSPNDPPRAFSNRGGIVAGVVLAALVFGVASGAGVTREMAILSAGAAYFLMHGVFASVRGLDTPGPDVTGGTVID